MKRETRTAGDLPTLALTSDKWLMKIQLKDPKQIVQPHINNNDRIHSVINCHQRSFNWLYQIDGN